MRSFQSGFLVILTAVLITSCQKEPDESILEEPVSTCVLTRAELLDASGAVEDTAGYTFTNNLVSKMSFTDVYYTFQYTSNKVSRRNYYQTGSVAAFAYDNVTYNTDGTVAKVETFASAPGAPAAILVLGYDLSYSGGKLIRMVEKIDTSFSGAPLKNYYEYDYTYTGNNITRYIENDIFSNLKDTVDFEFDNVANYFAKNPNALFTDLVFNELNGQLSPFLFSANNVIKVIDAGGETSVGYTLDDKKNLKEFLVGGAAAVRYQYLCK